MFSRSARGDTKTFPPFEPKSRRNHKTVDNPPHAVLRNGSLPALGARVEPNAGLTNTSKQFLEKGLATSPRSVRRRGLEASSFRLDYRRQLEMDTQDSEEDFFFRGSRTIPRMQLSEMDPRLRWGRGWSLTQD